MLSKDDIIKLNIINLEGAERPPLTSYDNTSYNLRLGKQFLVIQGLHKLGYKEKIGDCSKGTGILKLPAFSCALVSTEEWIKIPNNVFGRWGLKIRPAMSGLMFQAGPQIEPGSQGRLFGLLFNLTSAEKQLSYLTPMWSIDFERIHGTSKCIDNTMKTGEPILNMSKYTQMGIPSGSISEIYADYKKLQKSVSKRRDIGITIIVLLSSLLLPVVVTKLTYDKDDNWDNMKKRIELTDALQKENTEISELKKDINELKKQIDLLSDKKYERRP